MTTKSKFLNLDAYDPQRHSIVGLLQELTQYPHKLNFGPDLQRALAAINAAPFFVLCDAANEVWGCVALHRHERYVYKADDGAQMLEDVMEIDSIFIRQQHRGRGLSRVLIERMMFNVEASKPLGGVVIEITADATAMTIGQPLPYLMRMHDDCQNMGFTTIGLVCADNGELLHMDAATVKTYMEKVCDK